MSEAWLDLGGMTDAGGDGDRTVAGYAAVQLQCTAKWVRKDLAVDGVTLDVARVRAAIDAGYLDRTAAAKFVARRIGWGEAYCIAFGRYPVSPSSGVRPEWRRIPRRYLSPDEKRLADEATGRLAAPDEIGRLARGLENAVEKRP